MKKTKAFLCAASFLLAAMPALSSCNKQETHAMWLKIWAADKAVSLTRTQAKRWAKQMKDELGADIGIKVSAVGEGDAAANMITDVEAGADLFCFAQDQLSRLRSAGALREIIDEQAKAAVIAANDETSIAASMVDGALVAYPLTSDNGYFMYYDKSVFPDENGQPNSKLADIESIMAECNSKSKKLYFNAVGSAWYNFAYFYAFGCNSTWFSNPDGTFYDYQDNYNSKLGIKACKALYNLVNVNKSILIDDATASKAFAHKEGEAPGAAACVSGTWDFADAKAALGDNLGVVELPYVTLGEERIHLASFSGCKLMGVKPQENAEKGLYAEMLAEYLTGKECQLERFNAIAWGPCNKEAQQDEAVKASPTLAALNNQNKYALPQPQFPEGWWTAAAGITQALEADTCKGTDAEIANILNKYEGALQACINGQKPTNA